MKLLRSHYFLTFLFGVVLLMVPETSFAQEACEGVGGAINCAAQEVVFSIVQGILGVFVYLAALLLSFAVNSFVIGFGDAFVNTGIGVAVDNTWIIVRDFVNLGFIFGFIYIGFKMILSSSDSNTRRWLVNIILAALLVNFSLFIVKFAIDVSNQLAAQIAINGLGSTCPPVDADCLSKSGLRQVDLATEFMARLGINNALGLTIGEVDGKGWGYIFGTAILLLTAMFVFAAGGIMLIMRFAVLNLFMVLSPIMFLSWIIPSIKDTFQRFWSMFIGRALVAPIYLLFIYFSLQIISGLQVSVGENGNGFADPDWAGTFQNAQTVSGGNATGQLGTFPFFILICIFLGLSVWAADKLGADGGKQAMSMGKSFGNKVRGYTQRGAAGATLGVGARLGRNTIGRRLQQYADSDGAKDKAARSYIGKLQYKAAQKVGGASFDARQVGGVGKSLGIGEGAKGGYAKRVKDAKEEQKKFYGKDGLGFVDTDTDEAKIRIKERTAEIQTAKQKEIDETTAKFDDAATTDEEREQLLLKADKLKKEKAEAEKNAQAEIKFSRQIAYMKQLQTQKARWDVFKNRPTGVGSTVGGTAIGAIGGVATGAAGGIYGAAAAAGVAAKSDELAAIIKDIDNEYGKGGTKTIGKEASKEKAKAMIGALDELGDDKKGVNKDSSGDKKDDH